MGIREDFQKRIDKKQQEIADLELRIKEARAYMQALLDTVKILPKTAHGMSAPESQLRPGTALAKAREAIKAAGKPLHVNELLRCLDKPIDKAHKVSLSGSLAGYVRRGEIFTRPAPNTFGLRELEKSIEKESTNNSEDNIPETFGES